MPKRLNPTKSHLPRTDSSAGMRAAVEAPAPQPPSDMSLRKHDKPYFYAIVDNRAPDMWNQYDLRLAVVLARMMADHFQLQKQAERQGYVLVNDAGKHYRNPAFDIATKLNSDILATARTLHIHASAVLGDSADTGKRSAEQKATRKRVHATDPDDLIAKPKTIQ